jgi:serine/threonine protein kinase
MSSGKGKDNPAATAPPKEPGDLLTSEDIFGDMLDAPETPAHPRRVTPPDSAEAARTRKGPIKVKVSEPRLPESHHTGTPPAKEALPEDVAALLDAFSEPAEAVARSDPHPQNEAPARAPAAPGPPRSALIREGDTSALLESLVEEERPEAAKPAAADADSLLDAMMAPAAGGRDPDDDDPMGLLRDLERLGKPPGVGPASAKPGGPAWSYDVPPPASRLATRFKAAAPKGASRESGTLDLGALADEALGFAGAAPAAPHAAAAAQPAPPRAEPSLPEHTPRGEEPYGPYQLLEKIAVGGMAELFRAKRSGVEGFEKVVAVKRILPHLSDNKEFVDMFIDEAKMVAGLAHPNIVQIFDLGKIEKSYYIAMEYVHGRDLRSILRRAKERGIGVPLELAVLVVSKVCSALEYAHRKKDDRGQKMRIVHRDISPQNILISFEGDVKLTDFGIAKAATKATAHESGALRGKLLYMSPEQAWGKSMDRRSDIFSLGLVLYEMLTDQRPFLGNSELSILEMVRECRIEPASSVNPAIPETLERVTMKALARNPDERYADAAEMQQDLEAILHERRPATDADIARFMQLLFEQEERGEPVADEHTSGRHQAGGARGGGEGALAAGAAGGPPPAPDVARAEDTDGRGKETSSIQKFLRRFGIR